MYQTSFFGFLFSFWNLQNLTFENLEKIFGFSVHVNFSESCLVQTITSEVTDFPMLINLANFP